MPSPLASSPSDFDAIRRDERALAPVVAAAARACGLAGADARRFEDGSLPVYAFERDDCVLKLYPPCFAGDATTERSALEIVHARLPIPTPRVLAHGDAEGWKYTLMTRLRGRSLAIAWPEIPAGDRGHLLATLGAALRAMHAVPIEPIEGAVAIALPTDDWSAFIAAQRAGARERQRAHGLAAPWLDQIDDFLARTPLDVGALDATSASPAPSDARVLLHTEIMREHLLVDRDTHGWTLTGLFDFEPAMRGAPEYDLASAGVFASCGDAALFRELLLAYGYAPRDLEPELSRRILAYAILHRFSRLSWYLERVPPPAGATTLEDLAACWFGCMR